ncbi:MAG: deoxyribodipyrimidine photo-lyase [Chthoniobacter sp.]
MSTAIHWFRRDLRITDNTALAAAVAAHDHVVPVYIVSEWQTEHRWCGAPRQAFLCGCLASLAKNLEAKGGRLIIRRGRADAVLAELAQQTGADAIYFNRDPDPFGRAMEQRLEKIARDLGVRLHAHQDIALHERDELLTGSGTPFKVFTPYARAWLKLGKTAPGRSLSRISTPPRIASEPLPTLHTWKLSSDATIIEPGEAAARQRLGRFLDGPIFDYANRRDLPAEDGTLAPFAGSPSRHPLHPRSLREVRRGGREGPRHAASGRGDIHQRTHLARILSAGALALARSARPGVAGALPALAMARSLAPGSQGRRP